MKVDHGVGPTEPRLVRNFGVELSEDPATDAALERSLLAFLDAARRRALTADVVDPGHVAEHGFFFDELQGLSSTAKRRFRAPTVLRSYSKNGRDYFVTVSHSVVQCEELFTYRIIELKAVPHGDGYRFFCALDDRTETFRSTVVGPVTFHHSGELDQGEAREFASFYERFCARTKTEAKPLDYYCFATLDEMLTSHGILFSASKCNFLAYDLGLLESDGRTYLTGTNDAAYIPGFVEDYLERHVPGADQIYRPCAVGLAICYGNYFTSGHDLPTLKAQFRAALAARPDLDFLEEFRKGRGASIERHFCHFVICAFLCEQVLERRGFDAALQLVHSGPEGERFFSNLESMLGVDEAGFHEAVVGFVRG